MLLPTAKNRHGLPRAIPESVKLIVRRRCGFGCVICGIGLYEYEHFAPEYKDAHVHDADGITLLCPNHHTQKTVGRLSIERVVSANQHPEAVRRGYANDTIDFSATNPSVELGSMEFQNVEVLLQIIDEPILSIMPSENEGEPFQLSAKLRNIKGEVILDIEKNEWKSPAANWDCRSEGNRITIRSAPRKIDLVLQQEPPNLILVERLRMTHRGYIIEANKDVLRIASQGKEFDWSMSGMLVRNFQIGFILEGGNINIGKGEVKSGPGVIVGRGNGAWSIVT
jgi:hypothetical protein